MIGYACSEEEGPAVSCQPLEKVYEKNTDVSIHSQYNR